MINCPFCLLRGFLSQRKNSKAWNFILFFRHFLLISGNSRRPDTQHFNSLVIPIQAKCPLCRCRDHNLTASQTPFTQNMRQEVVFKLLLLNTDSTQCMEWSWNNKIHIQYCNTININILWSLSSIRMLSLASEFSFSSISNNHDNSDSSQRKSKQTSDMPIIQIKCCWKNNKQKTL